MYWSSLVNQALIGFAYVGPMHQREKNLTAKNVRQLQNLLHVNMILHEITWINENFCKTDNSIYMHYR